MCTGNDQLKQTQNESTSLFNSENARRNAAFGPLQPYATDLLNNGLGSDFNTLRDTTAGAQSRAAGTSRNAILRNFAGAGVDSSDPAVTQAMSDFESSRSRAADDQLTQLLLANRQAKGQGAQLLSAIAGGSSPYSALGVQSNLALGA